LLSKISKVVSIPKEKGRGESVRFRNWNDRQCRDYLQYKKKETDKAMPKGVSRLRVCCLKVMDRCSPTASPHPSDDEGSVTSITEETTKDTESDVIGEGWGGEVTTDMMELI
jgi:hypothetical protein